MFYVGEYTEKYKKFGGVYVKSDNTNFDGLWNSFARIRVILDIGKPLKRRMKIKREGGA